MFCLPDIRLVSVPNIEYFHKNKNLENKTAKYNILMQCSVHLILGWYHSLIYRVFSQKQKPRK